LIFRQRATVSGFQNNEQCYDYVYVGFLRRNFKTNEKSGVPSNNSKHARSRTYEKPSTSKEDLLQVPTRGASSTWIILLFFNT